MGNIPGGTIGPDLIRLDYDANGNVIYIGLSNLKSLNSESVWQIRLLTYDLANGNLLSILYAEGDKRYSFIWDNRAGYTYS